MLLYCSRLMLNTAIIKALLTRHLFWHIIGLVGNTYFTARRSWVCFAVTVLYREKHVFVLNISNFSYLYWLLNSCQFQVSPWHRWSSCFYTETWVMGLILYSDHSVLTSPHGFVSHSQEVSVQTATVFSAWWYNVIKMWKWYKAFVWINYQIYSKSLHIKYVQVCFPHWFLMSVKSLTLHCTYLFILWFFTLYMTPLLLACSVFASSKTSHI